MDYPIHVTRRERKTRERLRKPLFEGKHERTKRTGNWHDENLNVGIEVTVHLGSRVSGSAGEEQGRIPSDQLD